MRTFINKHKIIILLWVFIATYIVYFSYFTILRYKTLYASYYDLGIMNQTVYNTYKAIQEKDISRLLELTDPTSGRQIKRMAIHNDPLLALIAPLYFVYSGPETLLILQTVILGLGAFAVFKIALYILQKQRYKEIFALIFSLSYLLYPAMERSNIYEFHAVTLTTSFLLWMVYVWLQKKYLLSFAFLVLSLISKEQVGLTTALFGIYSLYRNSRNDKTVKFSLLFIIISVVWVIVSFFIIIPYFRGGNHFAVSRYGDFGDSPIRIIIGIIKNPYSLARYLFHINTLRYVIDLLGPLGFLSVISPIQLLIAIPEFTINLLSNTWGMKSIIYHYTAVITPFVFLSAIYGIRRIYESGLKNKEFVKGIIIIFIFFTLVFAYFKGPLPFTQGQEIHPFMYPQMSAREIALWANTLKKDTLKIASTGHAAPFFSSRRYYYLFSENYSQADYIVLMRDEIYNYPEKDMLIPMYEKLTKDPKFKKIYQSQNVEVYKKYDQHNNSLL
ncbi:DUF2079 domain-containing protein [Candidatus Roizmanbacteria bacterium]|nr:DUF2079 domain-containing protein [Candidatus Roizmanbacteria bacterium]